MGFIVYGGAKKVRRNIFDILEEEMKIEKKGWMIKKFDFYRAAL